MKTKNSSFIIKINNISISKTKLNTIHFYTKIVTKKIKN